MSRLNSKGRQRGNTADRIERAATSLFRKHGFEATTIRQIATACGLTAGAIYNHFSSKEELLYSIISRAHEEIHDLLLQAHHQADSDPKEQIACLVWTLVVWHSANQKVARVANWEYERLPETWKREIIDRRHRIRGLFEEVIERGGRERSFDLPLINGVADPKVLAMSLLNMAVYISEWFRPSGGWTSEQLAELYSTLVLRMVGVHKFHARSVRPRHFKSQRALYSGS